MGYYFRSTLQVTYPHPYYRNHRYLRCPIHGCNPRCHRPLRRSLVWRDRRSSLLGPWLVCDTGHCSGSYRGRKESWMCQELSWSFDCTHTLEINKHYFTRLGMAAKFGRNYLRPTLTNRPLRKVIITIVIIKLKLWPVAGCEANVAAELSSRPLTIVLPKEGGYHPFANFSLLPQSQNESNLNHIGDLSYILRGHFVKNKLGVQPYLG